jgi:hypothetical protein
MSAARSLVVRQQQARSWESNKSCADYWGRKVLAKTKAPHATKKNPRQSTHLGSTESLPQLKLLAKRQRCRGMGLPLSRPNTLSNRTFSYNWFIVFVEGVLIIRGGASDDYPVTAKQGIRTGRDQNNVYGFSRSPERPWFNGSRRSA